MLSKLEPETTEANLKLEEHGGVTPFFTDSQVEGTTHPLTKLLRLLFKRYDISEEKFQWYHKQYCQATMMAPSKASSSRNNLKRSLQSDTHLGDFRTLDGSYGFKSRRYATNR